mmetsp:Transcript_7795/g.13081  ORF Transcript_7795/g.13081 Transcript_7795/m.13081 type:complete len:93 (-) Transcript_7795:106-384(-)
MRKERLHISKQPCMGLIVSEILTMDLKDFKTGEVGRKSKVRFSNADLSLLDSEFEKDPRWNCLKIRKLAKSMGVSEGKIYKWNWERNRKSRE